MTSLAQLTIVVLFLCSISNPSFARRTSNRNPSADEAQEKFLNAQNTIIRIRAGEVIGETLDELKNRLTTIQNQIEQLIESTKTRSTDDGENCDTMRKNMIDSYESLNDRLRTLQTAFEQHSQLENTSSLFKEILDDIRHSRFKLADEKFSQLNDSSAIPKIVHEAYAHSEENFGMILNFAVEISDNTNCFTVLKTLHQEMSSNGHKTPQKLIILTRAYDNEVLQHKITDTKFRDELVAQIKTTASEVLIKAMKFGDFSTNDDIRNLLEALYDFDPQVSDDVMKRLVDESYGTVGSRALLTHMFIQCNTPQAVLGIENLFWMVVDSEHLNDSILILDIASNLKDLQARKDFVNLSEALQKSMSKVVDNLPKCARNLFFEPSVCLWNNAKKVYLEAANKTFNFDSERRRIFAAPSANGVPMHGAAWIPERKGDDILFKSKDYPNEYLYFAEIEYNPEMRYLFNWIVGGNRDKQSAFTVELLGDDSCYLKSPRFNEYMFVSDVTYKKDDNFSYVFSLKNGTVGEWDSEFAWQIKSC